jgi:hypothetical protein
MERLHLLVCGDWSNKRLKVRLWSVHLLRHCCEFHWLELRVRRRLKVHRLRLKLWLNRFELDLKLWLRRIKSRCLNLEWLRRLLHWVEVRRSFVGCERIRWLLHKLELRLNLRVLNSSLKLVHL